MNFGTFYYNGSTIRASKICCLANSAQTTNGRFPHRPATLKAEHLRQFSCCEHSQRKNRIHRMGSKWDFAAATQVSVSGKLRDFANPAICALLPLDLGAANSRVQPFYDIRARSSKSRNRGTKCEKQPFPATCIKIPQARYATIAEQASSRP